ARHPASDLRRPEQVPAEPRVADARVADDVDDRRLAGRHRALERRSDLVGPGDVLAVTADRLEHAVVAELGQHVEGVDPSLEHRHLIEARSPRAVVPEERHQGQAVLERGLELHAADPEAAVADHHDHLLAGARQLGADSHAAPSRSWRSTSFGSPTIGIPAGTCQPMRSGAASTWTYVAAAFHVGGRPKCSPLQNLKPTASTTSARPVKGFFQAPRTASGWSSGTAPWPARRA